MNSNRHQLIAFSIVAGLLPFFMADPVHCQTVEPKPTNEREIVFTVSVTNYRGFPIKGLKPEHFIVTSDKKPQEITTFSNQDEPVSIAFLIDTSNSMSDGGNGINGLRVVASGIENFLRSSHQENEYAILSFSNDIRQNLDWTRDKEAVMGSLMNLVLQPTKGRTALYDACRQGFEMMQSGSYRKRVIILLSDGDVDNASQEARFGKLKKEILANDALIYTVSISSSPMFGQDVLKDLAKHAGGLSLVPKNQFDVNASFELLAMLLRNQYSIGFKSNQMSSDGKSHSIKVEIKLPPDAPRELKYPLVKHRSGYIDRAGKQ